MNKRGDWDTHNGSWLYFFGGLIFLYLALMPFLDAFPFNFEIGGALLRILIGVIGVVILIESFTMDPVNKLGKVAIGLIFAVVGIYLFFSYQGASWIPFSLSLSDVILQILLIIYAAYLFIGAWRQ
ncbi:hypothetical protein K8R33_01735 [archaeon]|nr:hypothetical protein [archaeon]